MTDATNSPATEEYKTYSLGFTAVLRCLRALFLVLVIGISAALAWYLFFGGVFTVGPQENVIVLRFGRILTTYADGWHWSFPYPIDRIVRVPVHKFSVKTRNFWYRFNDPKFNPASATAEARENFAGGPLEPGLDGYLLTGDANIIHSEWVLEYHISNPEKYFLSVFQNAIDGDDAGAGQAVIDIREVRGGHLDALLRQVFENVIVKVTAGKQVEGTLYSNNSDYRDQVEMEVHNAVEALDIGVTADNAAQKRVAPPVDTQVAFSSVSSAENELVTYRDRARAGAIEIREKSESAATRTITAAEAYRKQTVEEIEAERDYFDVIYEKCRNSAPVLMTLYSETLSDALKRAKARYVVRSVPGGRQEVRLQLNNVNPKEEDMRKAAKGQQ